MNPFIVSQWYKYKDHLEVFYKTSLMMPCEECNKPNVGAAKGGLSKVCRQCRKDSGAYCDGCEDIDWPRESLDMRLEGKCVSDIMQEVLQNLLDHVINQGEASEELRYVSCSFYQLEGFCCDAIFLLIDRYCNYWIIRTFYGTYDNCIELKGLKKQQWLTLLMHLSLSFVQEIKQMDEYVTNSLVVSSTGSTVCSIHYLIDLQGITSMMAYHKMYLYSMLKDLPAKSLEPLFKLLPCEEWMPLTDILNAENVLEDKLFHELATINHPAWMMNMIYSHRAEMMTRLIAEYVPKGFLAICSRECGYLGECDYRHDESYTEMAEYDKEFDGMSYFLAYGQTLDELMRDLEKRYSDF